MVLVAPEIAPNTGNIIRLCANTGAALHLVRPLGFRMDDALLRRAGLDYHELASVTVHDSLVDCLTAVDGAPRDHAELHAPLPTPPRDHAELHESLPLRRRFAFRSQAQTRYDSVGFTPDDVLVFGAERAGLTDQQLAALGSVTQLRLPMRPGNRSLNLANAVAVVLYEAWRQNDFAGAAAGGREQQRHRQHEAGLTSETPATAPFDH